MVVFWLFCFCLFVVVVWLICTTSSGALFRLLLFVVGLVLGCFLICAGCHKLMLSCKMRSSFSEAHEALFPVLCACEVFEGRVAV